MINFPTKFLPVMLGTESGFGINPFPQPQAQLIKRIVDLIQEKKDILSKTENGKKILSLTVELDNINKDIVNKMQASIELSIKLAKEPWFSRAMNYPQIENLRAEISSLKDKQRNLVRELKTIFEKYYKSEAPPYVLWKTKYVIMNCIEEILSH